MIASDSILHLKIFFWTVVLIALLCVIVSSRFSQETYTPQDLFPNLIVEDGCEMAQVIDKPYNQSYLMSDEEIIYSSEPSLRFIARTKTGIKDYVLSSDLKNIFYTTGIYDWIKVCGDGEEVFSLVKVRMV